jgi:hypothetical protein
MAHVDAASGVSDHRITAIARRRIGSLDLGDRLENHGPGLGLPEIAGQHPLAARERSALLDPAHELPDHARLDRLAAKAAVPRMIGEQHGMDRPDLAAEPLEHEYRGGIADMAAGDVGVDGEEIHGSGDELRRCRGILPLPSGRGVG